MFPLISSRYLLDKNTLVGHVSQILSIIFWTGGLVAMKPVSTFAPPLLVVPAQMILGTIILFIFGLIFKWKFNLSRWQRVQLARHPDRPHSSDYIERIVEHWYELHGDRLFSDDLSLIGGCGYISNIKFIIISQEKGRGTKSKVFRNFATS